jgi:tetratricopeptide (TPR) repeat protein
MRRFCLLFLALVFAAQAPASEVDDARKLHEESQAILRKMSGAAADPKEYAEAVRKLEKAQALLEQAAKTDPRGAESLEQSVSSSLFWARRFANINVINELRKDDKPIDPNSAEAAFRRAEEFESLHRGDDYAISLRWFQYADQYSGTDWSLRAHTRAREAQARYQAQQAAKQAATVEQTPEAKLITEGMQLFESKDFEKALAKFEEAKKIKDSPLVERRCGHSYLNIGYRSRDEYGAQYLPLLKQYNDATARGDKAGAARLRSEAQILVNKLAPLEEKALKNYSQAEAAFKKGLELANGKDLDCETHLGIIEFARGKKNHPRARMLLSAVLDKYKAGNDEERTIYEYAKSLVGKLGGAIR